MRVLDLFSGIGGFSLGLERAGFRTVAFCEIEPYCRAVLAERWRGVPIHGDVRTLRGADVGAAEVICGGFPCQDISSVSRRRAGMAGVKSGLWSEFARLICELRPRYAIVENSPSLCVRGLGRILSDLADAGYDAEWIGIPAAAIRAHHLRARQWILAYPTSIGNRLQENTVLAGWDRLINSDWWASEPGIRRVADGVPARVDRLAALGNAVVPQIPEIIGRAILEAEARLTP